MEDNEVKVSELKTNLYGRKTKAVPKPKKNIGIDTEENILNNISVTADSTSTRIDLGELQKFTSISQRRDELYSLIDTMTNDSRLQAALETYAEDVTERNEAGKKIWASSTNEEISKYVNFLIDSLNIEKNIYKWTYQLCKYGDIYIRLFRESDVKDDLFEQQNSTDNRQLNEGINVIAYSKNDKYVHYIEMVPNPAEMFELIKFGKSYAYIQAPVVQNNSYYTASEWDNLNDLYMNYKFNRADVNLYPATEFVHACLDDNITRFPERVEIFRTDADYQAHTNSLSYSVRRGQSVLYSLFKTWRELELLENSVLLNRLTKSSIIKAIQVEVGDMPKEQVRVHLQNLKSMIEQKAALNINNNFNEYTNPGPVENIIYVPTHEGKGSLSVQEIGSTGGEQGNLADLDYFKGKLFSNLRIPKQFLGETDDSTGFNGGSSLTLVSSRYAKSIKKIQDTMRQLVADIINLLLVDKGLETYINKFTINMQAPTTQEDKDRHENMQASIGLVREIVDNISDIQDPVAKLKIVKAMYANASVNPEVLTIIQEQIEKLELEAANKVEGSDSTTDEFSNNDDSFGDQAFDESLDSGSDQELPAEAFEKADDIDSLPNMEDFDINFADNSIKTE